MKEATSEHFSVQGSSKCELSCRFAKDGTTNFQTSQTLIYPRFSVFFFWLLPAKDQIRTTVGQTRLLIGERFKQFEGLVDNCEFKRGEKETTCADLDGFWDMVNFQVCICMLT